MENKFNYFKGNSNFDFQYIKVPRDLIHSSKYSSISLSAKFLYITMLERLSLSKQNNWVDDNGNIYIILSQTEAMKILSCSRSKLVRIFAELDVNTGAGLIKRKRQGLCKPDIIYINSELLCNCTNEENVISLIQDTKNKLLSDDSSNVNNNTNLVSDKNIRKSQNETTECVNSVNQEVSDKDTNYINNNKNNYNKNNLNYPSFHSNPYNWKEERNEYKEIIKLNIDYDVVILERKKSIVDEIVNAMTNAVCSEKDFIRISGENIPKEEVKRKMLGMNQHHIEYVYDCLMKNTSSVRNVDAFLLTCLYRATDNINLHYKLQINHDLKTDNKVSNTYFS